MFAFCITNAAAECTKPYPEILNVYQSTNVDKNMVFRLCLLCMCVMRNHRKFAK